MASRLLSEQRNGVYTSYSYDLADQVLSDGTTNYAYDLNGNRTMTYYQTGPANQLTNDGVWTYSYDAEGNLIKKSKGPNAQTWNYFYDNANELVGAERRATDGGSLQMIGRRIENDIWTIQFTSTVGNEICV